MLDESGTLVESPLPPAILRGLGDRSYDKRKGAALDVTALIKSLHESNSQSDRIANVINLLAQEFTRSRNVHHRKGGLIGLAASAIGLVPDIDRYLHLLIPPVLECFDDPESRVCYYACESMYNISKVARTSVLKYFNQIFDGLCKLFAHVDVDVKNGANLLDRLIKDIVTETEQFQIELFIPLLQKHIKRTKPYIRQLLVGWITVLNAVPDINMLDYLPEFLDGLFNMLSDANREIKQAADNALTEFLREIKEAEVVEFGPMVGILVGQCFSVERSNRLTALKWVNEFIILGKTRLVLFYAKMLSSIMHCISDVEADISAAAKSANHGLMTLVKSTTEDFDLPPLLLILTTELQSEHVTTRVAALNWINMLHEKDAVEMNKSIAELLPALLKAISDVADEVVLITLQVTCLSCGVCLARLPCACLTPPPPHHARAPCCVFFFRSSRASRRTRRSSCGYSTPSCSSFWRTGRCWRPAAHWSSGSCACSSTAAASTCPSPKSSTACRSSSSSATWCRPSTSSYSPRRNSPCCGGR